jgi:hypothetical protein
MKAKYQLNDKIGSDNRDALIERCWVGLTKIENLSNDKYKEIWDIAFDLRYMLSTWYNDDRFYIGDDDDKLE